jgi:asparagine synthase (glutamine-hydrolysing)
MSGFTGIYIYNSLLTERLTGFSFPENLLGFYPLVNKEEDPLFRLCLYSNAKFNADTFLVRNKNVIGFEGVSLTKNNGFMKVNSAAEFIGESSFAKGSFSGVFIDEINDEQVLLTDQTGSKQLFYFWSQDFFAFSSSIFLLTKILSHFNIQTTLSVSASYMLLSLGYLLEDFTLISEIKKIKAGYCIKASSKDIVIEKYHDFYKKTEYNQCKLDLLVELDSRFKKSLLLEYAKDTEYNYSHLATLSGGLDSRLNVMLAHKYGYLDITCLTFSEGFKSDELTARKISSDLSLKHIVLLLNNGFQLYDIVTPLILNNCSVYYFGAAQTLAAVKRINFTDYGLEHNGGLAESSKGGYLSGFEHREPMLSKRYAVSGKLFDRLDNGLLQEIFNRYQNEEMFVTYNRGFNAIHNGSWMSQPYTNVVYTYMDTDFAELAYAVHPKLRYGGYLTIEWINKLHPELAKYPWLRGIRPTNNKYLNLYAKFSYRLELILTSNADIPVPLEEWYNNNIELKNFILMQYNYPDIWQLLPKELQKDIRFLFDQGTVAEKLLCISFLKSIELLFINIPV